MRVKGQGVMAKASDWLDLADLADLVDLRSSVYFLGRGTLEV